MYSAHNNQDLSVDELPDCVGKVYICDEANQQSRPSFPPPPSSLTAK